MASQANAAHSEPVIAAEPLGQKIVRQDRPEKVEVAKGSRQIVVSREQADYDRTWKDPRTVRQWLDTQLEQFPELLPAEMKHGYHLCGWLPEPVKLLRDGD